MLCEYAFEPNKPNCYKSVFEQARNKDICTSVADPKLIEECMCTTVGLCSTKAEVISYIKFLMQNYYKANNKNYSGFMQNDKNKKIINNLISIYSKEKDEKLNLVVYTNPNNYVIKTKFNNETKFYCGDSLGYGSNINNYTLRYEYRENRIEGDNYVRKAFCNGEKVIKNGNGEIYRSFE